MNVLFGDINFYEGFDGKRRAIILSATEIQIDGTVVEIIDKCEELSKDYSSYLIPNFYIGKIIDKRVK